MMKASAYSISYIIKTFLKSQNVEHLGANDFRHWVETQFENVLTTARSRAIDPKEVESKRDEMSLSMLHSTKTAARSYKHASKKQAELRSKVIDNLVTQSKTRLVEHDSSSHTQTENDFQAENLSGISV